MNGVLAWEYAGVITQLRIGTYRSGTISDKDTMAYKYIGFFKTRKKRMPIQDLIPELLCHN